LLKGIPASEGIALGRAWILKSPWDGVVSSAVKASKVSDEINRYTNSVKEVRAQLEECRERVENEIGEEEAQIFNAQIAILKDPFFQDEVPELIRKQKKNAEYVLKIGAEKLKKTFLELENEYFQHRIDDIHDVAIRILRVLLQYEETRYPVDSPTILVAHHLTPSDTARIDRDKIIGFATEMGGGTSHASILARSMGIPAVVGIQKLLRNAENGDTIVLDGNAGIVHVNPPPKILDGYKKRRHQFDVYWKRLSRDIDLPAVTKDGSKISLQANVSMTADVSLAIRYNAHGIGLFRTELPFLMAGRLLTEEEQVQIYQTIVQAMKGKTVTIRTLDLGGDKFLPFQNIEEEQNPFMGWRSIRIFLQEKDVFKDQLRAILRASHFGQVRIMFPMISSLKEVEEIRKVVEEAKEDLRKADIPFDEQIKTGIMIEVPSAAILADRLVLNTDFVSIGTNDLIQYTLAVDRNNEKVAKFYQPLNPSVLYLIHRTIQAAREANKPVSLCGEMAGNPLYAALLIGFGLRDFSMSPMMLPEIKERIRAVDVLGCEEMAHELLQSDSTEIIEKKLWDFHNSVNKKQSVPYLGKKKMTIS